jgi:hypothetical protein
MVRPEHYHHHFNEESLIKFMYHNTYDNVTIKSNLNGFYYNIQIDGYNDYYEDYWFDWVEHIPMPSKIDKDFAQEYETFLANLPKNSNTITGDTKYKDDTYIMELVENGK